MSEYQAKTGLGFISECSPLLPSLSSSLIDEIKQVIKTFNFESPS